MHTYKKQNGNGDTVPTTWEVGYYTMEVNYSAGMAGGVWPSPSEARAAFSPPVVSTWQLLSEHDSEESAIERVNLLNGGSYAV